MPDPMPIATAPRDGTRVLVQTKALYGLAPEWEIVRWTKDPDGPGDSVSWYGDSAGPGYSNSREDSELSYWLPLPSIFLEETRANLISTPTK